MMNTPKISILVPVYNVEKYLDRCIQSILNQTLKEQPNHQNQEMKQIFQMQDLTLHYEQNLILHFFYE